MSADADVLARGPKSLQCRDTPTQESALARWADTLHIGILRPHLFKKFDPMLQISSNPAEFEALSHGFQLRLMAFNASRLKPGRISANWQSELKSSLSIQVEEGIFLEGERAAVQKHLADLPKNVEGFMTWFESLRQNGPGQGDPLFPWLAQYATLDEMKWFLTQEAAGEAGFDDLVALAQLRMPVQAKLEMSRNYWDEMGRGHESAMHGPLLSRVVELLELAPVPEHTVWESLALANTMAGLALNRRYAYQIIGALGVVEMTAPGRVSCVNEGLKRLGVPDEARTYFQLHAGLDIKHSLAWNEEVLFSLVRNDPGVISALAEGALMRLVAGARCFGRYRNHFGLTDQNAA